MQIIFKAEWSSAHKFRGNRQEQAVAWSRKNVIAFCIGKEEIREDVLYGSNEFNSRYCIYVIHPNYPWELHRIDTDYEYPIEHLHWDSSGSLLLTCDIKGKCVVWSANEVLFNNFGIKKEIDFNCRIICLGWLGLETTQAFDCQSTAKDILDKFPQRVKRLPLIDIGGQIIEGIIVVTFLGQVFVATLGSDPQCASLQLSNANVILTHGDITITDNGKVSVVVADSEQCVQAFNITVKKSRTNLSLSVESQPCLVPSKLVDDLSLPFEITKVAFPLTCASETVLVCCRNSCSSIVKCFDLCKERISMHPRYQRSVQHLSQLPTVYVWGCSKVMSVTPVVEALAMPRILLPQMDCNRPNMHFTSLTTISINNKVARIGLPNLVQQDECNLDLGDAGEFIKTICHSPLDLHFAFVTNKGNIGVACVRRFNEYEERLSLRFATNLMEYAITTGLPSWEIAAAVSCYGGGFGPHCLSSLQEELTDQKSNQDIMFLELLQLEANIFTTVKDGYIVAFECYNALLFKAIRTFIHSVVDGLPSDKDLNLLNRIRATLDKQGDAQISKIAQAVDCSESTENGKIISEIHFLLQWIVDYAIHFGRILATVDFKSRLSQLSCFANGTLIELQEMLVLIYIWGQRFPSWQPNVVTLGNPLDGISQIFHMIVKLQFICNGENVTTSLDDIPLKSLQLMYCDVPGFDPSGSVLSILHQCQSVPCNSFEFSQQEDINSLLKHAFLGHPLTVGQALNKGKGTLFYDGINCSVLKLLPNESLKQCVHCRILTLNSPDSKRCLNMNWMGRWRKGCVCGGPWKLVGN